MEYFVLSYKTVDNFIGERESHRPEHLVLVKQYFADGYLLLGGALENPKNEALLIFKTNGIESIEAFIKKDPYVQNGLVTEWAIRKWNVAIGGDIKN